MQKIGLLSCLLSLCSLYAAENQIALYKNSHSCFSSPTYSYNSNSSNIYSTMAAINRINYDSVDSSSQEKVKPVEMSIKRYTDCINISGEKGDLFIPNHQVSKDIRSLNDEQLKSLLDSGSHYLNVSKCSDGSHTLSLQGRIKGSGPVGAKIGFWVGRFAVHMVIQGTVVAIATVVSIPAPALFIPTLAALEKTVLPISEPLSHAGAIIGALIGGTSTAII
jgi:hypothetical protein